MRALLVLVLASVLAAGCSGGGEDFQSRLRTIKIGMGQKHVEEILGQPSHLWTETNHPGTWTVGTSEVWSYSAATNSPLGAVYFDERGGVQFVYGHNNRIAPPERNCVH
jgi:hypothetical protein